MGKPSNISFNYGIYNEIDINDLLPVLESLVDKNFRIKKLAYHLISDEELLKINRDHLDHDYYTDIITFDYSRGNVVSGEVYISMDRVIDNSDSGDVFTEFLRVVSHGLLHLIGYKDKHVEEIAEMRRMENLWINELKVSRGA